MGLAEDILSMTNPSHRVPVKCRALEGKGLFLRPAGAGDVDAYAAALRGDRYGGSPSTAVACRLLVDATGKPVFDGVDPDDVALRLHPELAGALLNQVIDDGLLGRSIGEAEGNSEERP